MNWRLKAAVQRLCAALPGYQENVYYGLQRSFGHVLYKPDPLEMLSECATLIALLQDSGISTERARILEVGTGRRLDMPIGFYLAGAASTKTFDLHRYLKPALVMRTLEAIRAHREQVRQYVAPYIDAAALARRLDALCAVDTFPALLCLTGIEYRAPGDAAVTGLHPAQSMCTSHTRSSNTFRPTCWSPFSRRRTAFLLQTEWPLTAQPVVVGELISARPHDPGHAQL